MRKNIIALMLVLPLLFVFAVFSSGQVASLGVDVSVSGIRIMNAPEDKTLRIDLAETSEPFRLDAQVMPDNATEKGVTYRVEEVEGAQFASVSVAADGTVSAESVGSARVVAVSNDGGYTDSITVVVSSSRPYGMEISLFAEGAEEALPLTPAADGGLQADVSAGRYRFQTKLTPAGFEGASVTVERGFADVEGDTFLLPFAGTVTLRFTVKGGVNGDLVQRISLRVSLPQSVSGITVNGGASAAIVAEEGASSITFYAASAEQPVLSAACVSSYEVTPVSAAGEGCWKITARLSAAEGDHAFTLTAGGGEFTGSFSFAAFAFTVRSTLPVQGGEPVMLAGSPVTFYPVASVASDGVSFVWELEEGSLSQKDVTLTLSGNSCTVDAKRAGTFTLIVTPFRGGHALDVYPVELSVEAVRDVTNVQFLNSSDMGLAQRLAVAGTAYAGDALVGYDFVLDVRTYHNTQTVDALEDLSFTVSDSSVLSLQISGGKLVARAVGEGTVTVTASWLGNDSFGRNVAASFTFDAVGDGVLCSTSAQVFAAANAGLPVVLGADVMLGEEIKDNVPALKSRLGSMKSTYNTHFYDYFGRTDEEYVNYVIEFKNDVFGNGYTLNAEYFTNAKDGTDTPLIFRGPIAFVDYGEMARVAGQDNISFLVRTDGVTLHNVNLLGCSDSSLEVDGTYELTNLNNVGTVLEINADCSVLNCRIRNGRTVVRAYGGNRDGQHYFIERLSQNEGCDAERIHVRIEGCIVSQAREFLVKVGANRALRATAETGVEPRFTDANGNAYPTQTNDYLNDEYFYSRYVLTDLTLQNSVLETSGLFSVGIESNFAGPVLAENSSEQGINFEGWAGAGGTSFASVVRLVGDVRMYDWKQVSHIDSSTLIESMSDQFKMNIGGMLDFATSFRPQEYGDLLATYEGEKVVHGGIAAYGGGINYAQIDLSQLDGARADLTRYLVNISILTNSDDSAMQDQGSFLPLAAGTQDFRFYMYSNKSANSYTAQLADAANGVKYAGVSRVSPF